MSDHLPVSLSLWPGGKPKAVTLSYDDGVKDDQRLVQILNRHGLRGTFHINSGTLGRDNKLAPEEVREVYRGHEVSAHTVTHPFLTQLPPMGVIQEITEDRHRLEELCGYPVRGMSYPYGNYNKEIVALLPSLGIRYSRTTKPTNNFDLPEDFLEWHPSIHHKHDLLPTTQRFLDLSPRSLLRLLYVWGHSYEFPRDNNWELMEQFGLLIGKRDDIWYATNIEIFDYVQALRRIEFSADFTVAINPTAAKLWVMAGKTAVRLSPGSRTDLVSGKSVPTELWKPGPGGH